MYARISTVSFVGMSPRGVEVEVRVTPGAPAFSIVGLPDKAVTESRERIRGALHSVGLGLPYKHLTINLAPADLPKEGSHFDLPITLALMAAIGVFSPDIISRFVAIGELELNGSLRTVPGGLPAALEANSLNKGFICPQGCGAEAAWADEEMEILSPSHLLELINHFKGLQSLTRPHAKPAVKSTKHAIDLRDVRGQANAKRILEIAAAGGHNLLMIGPPGSGKTLLASRLPSILPPLSPEEILEVSMIYSLSGELKSNTITTERPFRSPHHSASMAALVGGGAQRKPGEITLAHLGVLFLDELAEFAPKALNSLRQPLEKGETVIARAGYRVTFPSRFQLVGAMNRCRCGESELGIPCKRGPKCAVDYQARISGPLLDRIDLQVEIPSVKAKDLVARTISGESSQQVQERVKRVRQVQNERISQLGEKGTATNASCSTKILEQISVPKDESLTFLKRASQTLNLSARGFYRTLRVARTLADLEGQERIAKVHIAEALSYRREVVRSTTTAS